MEVLLEEKVKLVETLLLLEFCAVAVKVKMVPSCTEVLTGGFKVILAG